MSVGTLIFLLRKEFLQPQLFLLSLWFSSKILLLPSAFSFMASPEQLTLSLRLATPQLTALETLGLLSSAKTGAVNF